MKSSEKLYKWFYQSKSRTTANIISGASLGLVVWVFSLIFDRLIGLDGTFFFYLPSFVTAGMIVGAIIGMISKEVLWHNEQSSHKQKE